LYWFIIEKPAIDCLLDHIWNQEARKPAIDKLIQEYLERIGSPSIQHYSSSSSYISPLMSSYIWIIFLPFLFYIAVETEIENKSMTSTCSQQTQTPNRGIQHYQSAPSFYHTPMTSGNDSNNYCVNNYEFQHTASTPLLQ
jgi:hypothetical protein